MWPPENTVGCASTALFLVGPGPAYETPDFDFVHQGDRAQLVEYQLLGHLLGVIVGGNSLQHDLSLTNDHTKITNLPPKLLVAATPALAPIWPGQ